MSKKLMLLAAGALIVLAFAALPAVASAGEFEAHCINGAAKCEGTITSTTEATLTTDSGAVAEKLRCTGPTSGTATQTSTSSTGTLQLVFTGCKDEVFGAACQNGAAGVITTNVMTSHLIYIDPNKSTPGVLLTGANITFTCNFGFTMTVTGNLIGHWTKPECGKAVASHIATFDVVGNLQRYTQVTTTGTVFNLTSGLNHQNGNPDTTAFTYKNSWSFNTASTFTC
jgi:hypothetical protein